MTKEQIDKLKVKDQRFIIPIVETEVTDKYGYYCTGIFKWKGKVIVVNIEGGKWHLSASANHPFGYYEIKELRYTFLPNNIRVAQIFPPREEFVNIHENCYHLFEI